MQRRILCELGHLRQEIHPVLHPCCRSNVGHKFRTVKASDIWWINTGIYSTHLGTLTRKVVRSFSRMHGQIKTSTILVIENAWSLRWSLHPDYVKGIPGMTLGTTFTGTWKLFTSLRNSIASWKCCCQSAGAYAHIIYRPQARLMPHSYPRWTYQEKFRAIVNGKPQGKHTNFANSVLKLIEDYGFDVGIFFMMQSHCHLTKIFRAQILTSNIPTIMRRPTRLPRFWKKQELNFRPPEWDPLNISWRSVLTPSVTLHGCSNHSKIAAPCGPSKYQMLPVARMDKVLDLYESLRSMDELLTFIRWNLMAYDFGTLLTRNGF